MFSYVYTVYVEILYKILLFYFIYHYASLLCLPLQFMERLKLFFIPPKYQSDLIYLRHVPLRKVHLFTLTQILCLIILWILKSTEAAIIFPLMVLHLFVHG